MLAARQSDCIRPSFNGCAARLHRFGRIYQGTADYNRLRAAGGRRCVNKFIAGVIFRPQAFCLAAQQIPCRVKPRHGAAASHQKNLPDPAGACGKADRLHNFLCFHSMVLPKLI